MSDNFAYLPRSVCSVLHLSHGTLSTWTQKKVVRNLDAQKTSAGRARQFPTSDVLAIALYKTASENGFPNQTIGALAKLAAEEYLKAPSLVSSVKMSFAENGGITWRYNDEAYREREDSLPPAPVRIGHENLQSSTVDEAEATMTITFNLHRVFEPVLAALEDEEPVVIGSRDAMLARLGESG